MGERYELCVDELCVMRGFKRAGAMGLGDVPIVGKGYGTYAPRRALRLHKDDIYRQRPLHTAPALPQYASAANARITC